MAGPSPRRRSPVHQRRPVVEMKVDWKSPAFRAQGSAAGADTALVKLPFASASRAYLPVHPVRVPIWFAWTSATLLTACLALLQGPLAEASRSPVSLLHATGGTPGAPRAVDVLVADLLQMTRQRRHLTALIAEGHSGASQELTQLDARLDNAWRALSDQSSRLPTTLAHEIDALLPVWRALTPPGQQAPLSPSIQFAQHGEVVDRLLSLADSLQAPVD